jgi:hypothetical protein
LFVVVTTRRFHTAWVTCGRSGRASLTRLMRRARKFRKPARPFVASISTGHVRRPRALLRRASSMATSERACRQCDKQRFGTWRSADRNRLRRKRKGRPSPVPRRSFVFSLLPRSAVLTSRTRQRANPAGRIRFPSHRTQRAGLKRGGADAASIADVAFGPHV